MTSRGVGGPPSPGGGRFSSRGQSGSEPRALMVMGACGKRVVLGQVCVCMSDSGVLPELFRNVATCPGSNRVPRMLEYLDLFHFKKATV